MEKISLYLAGKYSPYYQAPYDKLHFIEILRAESPKSFTTDFFKIIDSNDFYSNCLNRVKRYEKSALRNIYRKLNIPKELYNTLYLTL